MPNPTRPNFGEVIDETWGDLTADHVLRRYVNAAERDADVAGLTPAALAGQLIAIVPGGAAIPYFQEHDGTAWRSLIAQENGGGIIVKVCGFNFIRSDANGMVTITFGQPFATKLEALLPSSATDSSSGRWLVHVNWQASNTTKAVLLPVDSTGNGRANMDFGVSAVAFGH
jgi:hypothetical protein